MARITKKINQAADTTPTPLMAGYSEAMLLWSSWRIRPSLIQFKRLNLFNRRSIASPIWEMTYRYGVVPQAVHWAASD